MSGFTFLYFIGIYAIMTFEIVLLIMNYRFSTKPPIAVPGVLRDVYTPELVEKSILYTKARGELQIFSTLVEFAFVTAGIFWLFPLIERIAVSLTGSFVWQGVLFFAILALIGYLSMLPFHVYSTFVLERRFGFNKTAPATFIADSLKEILLIAAIGVPLLALSLMAIEKLAYWWIYLLLGIILFQLLSGLLYPVLILPLFSKLKPLEDGQLKQAIFDLSKRSGFEVKSIFVMDASKRTGHTNAFFTGFGKARRIVLYDTLIEKHSLSEIEAIFAHEAGHYKYRHTLKGTVISSATTGLSIFLLWFMVRSGIIETIFAVEREFTALLYSGVFVMSLFSVFGWLGSYISRRWEFAADSYAAEIMGTAGPMIDALKRLSASNLSNLRSHPLYTALNYSHPTTLERIEKLCKIDSNIDEEIKGVKS
jgi:STE24 endopeptidase